MRKEFWVFLFALQQIFCSVEEANCLGLDRECRGLGFQEINYFIKPEYISRTTYVHFDDRNLKDQYQDEVYAYAFRLAEENGLARIADIGCGSGYKLLKYFSNFETVGFEIDPTLTFLREKYPDRNWESSDFRKDVFYPHFDLLICSDVIEHLVNPDDLLSWISNLSFDYLVISTPDRDQLHHFWRHPSAKSLLESGPPINPAHIREWSYGEFEKYLANYFLIINHFHSEREMWDQVIIAKKK